MYLTPTPPVSLTAERSPWLRGPIRVPGDAAASRLALLLAAMARGESVIESLSGSPDIPPLIAAIEQLGVHIARHGARWHVEGIGVGGFLAPAGPIDVSAMGEGALLLIALLAAHDFESRFTGVPASAWIDALLDFIHRNGSRVERDGTNVMVRAPRFGVPLDLALPPGASALQPPLLLQSLVLTGTSVLHLPEPGGDAAEGVLAAFGAKITDTAEETGTRVAVEGMAPLRALAFGVPGDPVLAAFPAVAALIAPDSEITVEALSLNHSRLAVLDALQMLGSDIALEAPKRPARDTADLVARYSKLTGTVIPADLGIDLDDFAILAVAAAFAEGETLLEGLSEGQKRLSLSRALRANGVPCEERPQGLAITGRARVPGGGKLFGRLDPKLSMSFLVLGMAADKPVTIDDGGVMAELFPGFAAAFEHVGASFSTGKPA